MIFASNVFLFLYLPLFLAVYFLARPQWRSTVIVAASYIFYAWWRPDFLLLFVAITYWNYWFGLRIKARLDAGDKRWAFRLLWIGIIGNLSTLGYFKYALRRRSAGRPARTAGHQYLYPGDDFPAAGHLLLCVPCPELHRRHLPQGRHTDQQLHRLCRVRCIVPSPGCRADPALQPIGPTTAPAYPFAGTVLAGRVPVHARFHHESTDRRPTGADQRAVRQRRHPCN